MPRGPENRWIFEGRTGQGITITAESYEFDIHLLLNDPQGRRIAWSDASGCLLGARIHTVLPADGMYTAALCGVNADHYGRYWLALDEGDQPADWTRSDVEAYYGRGIVWARRTGNSRALSWLNLGEGRFLRQQRKFGEAEKCYSASMASAIQAGFEYGQWAVKLETGRLLARRMRYDEALSEFQSALELSKKLRAPEDAEAPVLMELGNLYMSTRRVGLAKFYLDNAQKLVERSGLPAPLVEEYTALAASLNTDDKEKAIEYAEKAYALSSGLNPILRFKAASAQAAARLFLQSGSSEDGFRLAAEACDTARRLGCVDDEVAIATLTSMGFYRLNRIDEMVRSAHEALELTSQDDEDPASRRVALQLEADGEMLRGNYYKALQNCMESLTTLEADWAKQPVEELRQYVLSQSKSVCNQIMLNLYALNAYKSSPECARLAFDFAERSQSRSLLNQVAYEREKPRSIADKTVDDQDRRLLEEMSALSARLMLLRAEGNLHRDSFLGIEQQREHLLAERMHLRSEAEGRTDAGHDGNLLPPLTAEQVQSEFLGAHPKSLILYYQLGIQQSFLIAMGRYDAHLFVLPNRSTVSKAVAEWRSHIIEEVKTGQSTPQAVSDYIKVSHKLYMMLISPAENYIKGRDLIIVPSDALCGLAFEALVAGPDRPIEPPLKPTYVVEQHSITYAPSISTLALIDKRQGNLGTAKDMLLLADRSEDPVDLSNPGGRELRSNESSSPAGGDSNEGGAAPSLPGAQREVAEIAKLAKTRHIAPTIWLGLNPDKHQFLNANLSPYRFIHLATHSVADYQNGLFSALTFSGGPKGTENEFLTSYEIANLKLDADLVVLSGCETGAGQKTGAEGIIGLTRAFLIAGSHRVCGSLWKVEDSSTESLMIHLYRSLLAEGLTAHDALRQAKIGLLRQGAMPSQWAAFVLFGPPG
jgi:CHAT domain-containing protein/tetratricopeptide (TPR) repeat protein